MTYFITQLYDYFGINLEKEQNDLIKFGFSILLLAPSFFTCLLNIYGISLALYLSKNTEFNNKLSKYPRVLKWVKRYESMSILSSTFYFILGLILLSILIIAGIFILTLPVFK